MKKLLLMLLCLNVYGQDIFNMDNILMSVQPEKKEEMKCYPISQVKKWGKKKKKAPQVVEKIVEKQVIVEKEILVEAPKNSASLIGGRTQTGLKGHYSTSGVLSTTTGEFDLGLMYQRRINKYRLSGIATMNGSFYLGAGLDF